MYAPEGTQMSERGDWLAPAELDRVTVTVDFQRDQPGHGVKLYMAGHSQKRLAPLWTWEEVVDDPRNVESTLGWVASSVVFYRPTDPTKFLRACVGGTTDGPEQDPLPFT